MHISEGVLSGPLLFAGYVCAVTGTAVGLRKMDVGKVTEAGVLSAAFFVASLVHLPIGFSNAHLTLSGLVGLLLGWSAFPVILVALIIQAVIFQYGGITTLGVNTTIMALPAVFCYYTFGFLSVRNNVQLALVTFGCGAVSVFMGGLLASGSLLLAHSSFREVAMFVMVVHVPMMIVEGAVTACCVSFLSKVKPEILPGRLIRKTFCCDSNFNCFVDEDDDCEDGTVRMGKI